MSRDELVTEIRAAASSLVTAAAATENGDLAAAARVEMPFSVHSY